MTSTHLHSLCSAQQLNTPTPAVKPQIMLFWARHQDIVKAVENSFLCPSDKAHKKDKQLIHLWKLGKTEKKAEVSESEADQQLASTRRGIEKRNTRQGRDHTLPSSKFNQKRTQNGQTPALPCLPDTIISPTLLPSKMSIECSLLSTSTQHRRSTQKDYFH